MQHWLRLHNNAEPGLAGSHLINEDTEAPNCHITCPGYHAPRKGPCAGATNQMRHFLDFNIHSITPATMRASRKENLHSTAFSPKNPQQKQKQTKTKNSNNQNCINCLYLIFQLASQCSYLLSSMNYGGGWCSTSPRQPQVRQGFTLS